MLGAVSCITVVHHLQVHRFVLNYAVCHNKFVGHSQVQQSGAIVSNRCWETKLASSTAPQLPSLAPKLPISNGESICIREKKRKEKEETTPFGVNSIRSQV